MRAAVCGIVGVGRLQGALGMRLQASVWCLRRKRPKVTKWLLRFLYHILNENLVPVLLAAMGCGPCGVNAESPTQRKAMK